MYQFIYRVKGQEGRRSFTVESLPHTCHGEPSIQEQIVEELRHEDVVYGETPKDYELDFFREYTRSRSVGVTTIRLVEIGRGYGGPEEGGWYYDYENLIREWTVPTSKAQRLRERLERYAEESNQHRRWDEKLRVFRGAWEPREKPHYC